MPPRKTPKPPAPHQPPCHACNGLCCRHVALRIDTPTCKHDYDNIRWYLMHEGVTVGIDGEGDWLLEVATPCKLLDKKNACTGYDDRPGICRSYPGKEEECEFESADSPYTTVFGDHQAFERYLGRIGKKRRRRGSGGAKKTGRENH